jgi:2-polyprenyl-3-methyl-5-hydroxy-6-metoxy-1,4-benzoquinol methylase
MASPYYKRRPEIEALVPREARVVLDVGCGTGLLGHALKQARPGIAVYGVEPRAEAAAEARARLDGVSVALAGDPLPSDWPAPDCVVLADVLEHCERPWPVLASIAARLPRGGSVVASVPNVLHYTALGPLLGRARWDYVDAGILDRTHLRFFTRPTAIELFEQAGLRLETVERQLMWPGSVAGTCLRALLAPARVLEARRGVPRRGPAALDLATLQLLIVARRD